MQCNAKKQKKNMFFVNSSQELLEFPADQREHVSISLQETFQQIPHD